MSTDFQDSKYKDLTDKIIKIFCKVYNRLGYGFLEKVYEKAMMKEFKKCSTTLKNRSVCICVDLCPIDLNVFEKCIDI